jgi:hypothetical protein
MRGKQHPPGNKPRRRSARPTRKKLPKVKRRLGATARFWSTGPELANAAMCRAKCTLWSVRDELLSQGRIKEISNTHLIESAWQAYKSNLHLEATVSEGRDGIKIEQQLEGRLEEGRMMHFRQIRYKY